MSYKSLQYLLRKLKVSIFWQIKQKFENLTVKVAMVKSASNVFFFDKIEDFTSIDFALRLM